MCYMEVTENSEQLAYKQIKKGIMRSDVSVTVLGWKGRLTTEKEDAIIHDYVDNEMSLSQVADKHGIASQTVVKVLKRHGKSTRSVSEGLRLWWKRRKLGLV